MVFSPFIPQVKDTDGFAPPLLGGPVNIKFASFAYNTTGIASGATLFTLPYNAEIVGYILNISTVFNGTGTNTIDFGTTGALTQFVAAQSAAATGQVSNGFTPAQMFTPLTGATPFIVRYNGTSASTGAAVVGVLYVERG